MRKYIELTEYDSNGRTVIFTDSIQGLCRVRDGEYNKEFTEVIASSYTFMINEPIDEILEKMERVLKEDNKSLYTVESEDKGELYDGEFENFTRDNVEINYHEERVKEMAEALNMIPVSVIEDIKSEIEHEGDMYPDGDWYISIDRVCEIFDKHTKEQSE